MRWPFRTLEERFWQKVNKAGPLHPTLGTPCWVWTASGDGHGYGRIATTMAQGPVKVHRVSWELHNGPIPPGLHVLHRCDNPPCVNPAHLFLGTFSDNMMDKCLKGRAKGPKWNATHCKRGHEFTPENTIMKSYNGKRACRACIRLRDVRRAS